MPNEPITYVRQIKNLLDRLCEAVADLDERQLNLRPPVAGANSAYAIAAHILGNAEAWILGIACGLPIERDRPGEFAAAGAGAAPLIARANELALRFEKALSALPSGAFDEVRQPSQTLWGEGSPHPVTVREAILHAIEHAALHLGQLDVTRDFVLTGVGSEPHQ